MIDERRRPDFTKQQEDLCKGLNVLGPQIEDLGRKIRNDRKRSSIIVMPPNSAIEYAFCELEGTVNSYQEICGGYWTAMDLYPNFESFIKYASEYLEETLQPCLDKISKIEMPEKGTPEASMVESFEFYLERAENIHEVTKSILHSLEPNSIEKINDIEASVQTNEPLSLNEVIDFNKFRGKSKKILEALMQKPEGKPESLYEMILAVEGEDIDTLTTNQLKTIKERFRRSRRYLNNNQHCIEVKSSNNDVWWVKRNH